MNKKNILKIEDCEFLNFKYGNTNVYFSTSKGNLDFNKNKKEGIKNLNKLKSWFNLEDIGYLNQIHSDIIYIYDGTVRSGDAIITDKKEIGIGIFTADCVPVIVYDEKLNVAAAIHSGWKGTLNCIVSKTIQKMSYDYGTNIKDIHIWIGPHNKQCCYEVSEELILKFKGAVIYENVDINNGRKLNLEKCIITQLKNMGVHEKQITLMKKCTYCDKENAFYSYRKNGEESGRMFSFIIMK